MNFPILTFLVILLLLLSVRYSSEQLFYKIIVHPLYHQVFRDKHAQHFLSDKEANLLLVTLSEPQP